MEITVKGKACTWQGRTVWRSYYLTNGTWRRYGRWEAASLDQLKQIVNTGTSFSAAKLTWKD